MPFSIIAVGKYTQCWLILSLAILFSHGLIVSTDALNTQPTKLGIIIDLHSRTGKEQKTAMEIAVQNYNLGNNKLLLNFRDSKGEPLRAALAAEELIKEEHAQVIIGMNTWAEAALVSDIGNRYQIPVLSFSKGSVLSSQLPMRWPFLIRIAKNDTAQMACIAKIVQSYGWRRVVAVYEDDVYGGESGQVTLLSESLRKVGAEIDHRVVFPPESYVSDPKELVIKELKKLENIQPRVFIVLRSSMSLASHLFQEAKHRGLMIQDTVWIVTDAISSLLESCSGSYKKLMSGALGIKSSYKTNRPYRAFRGIFRRRFRSEYAEEDIFEPGIHALQAYDSIVTVMRAVAKSDANNVGTYTSKALLRDIQSSNFTGLSGEIRFDSGELARSSQFKIINVVGNGYKTLDFWSPDSGLFKSVETRGGGIVKEKWNVNWPGDSKGVPKGWEMPNKVKKLKIGVPGRTSFEKFVKVDDKIITGFCISIFEEVVQRVEKYYPLPYVFEPHNCTYDELIDLVYNKTLDAVVGDVTILAQRMKHVEFTQPFTESGLSMIVPVKSSSSKAWIFLKPFTMGMWIVTGGIMVYTMIIVWLLEHGTNPQFRGPWNDQLGTVLWFTFSSLFFAHREKIESNFTRVVVVVWLFVVLILTSSYTASLSSMLTVQRLEPNVTDINWLRNTKQKIGCDGDSFVRKYLENVLDFDPDNILNVTSQYNYPREFKAHNITAAFLEVPYAKAFLNQYCTGYTVINPTYRFGGLAFVFQMGSPIALDFSEAILKISEDGTLKGFEETWFSQTACSSVKNSTENGSLGLQSFWGLYAITGGTSTICFLTFIGLLIKKFYHRQKNECKDNATPEYSSVWYKAKRFAQYFHEGGSKVSDVERCSSPQWVYVTALSATPEHPQTIRKHSQTIREHPLATPDHPQTMLEHTQATQDNPHASPATEIQIQ